jgi:hypothetical protein
VKTIPFKTLAWLAFCGLFAPSPAVADTATPAMYHVTAYQMHWAYLLILPAMAIITLGGGGYRVLKYRRKQTWFKYAAIPFWAMAVMITGGFLAQVSDLLVLAVCLVFGAIAANRAVLMLKWAWAAQHENDDPALAKVSPSRMTMAGAALLLVVVFLCGMAAAFYNRALEENAYRFDREREAGLLEYTAFQTAVAKAEELNARQRQDLREKMRLPLPSMPSGSLSGYRVETDYSADGRKFTVLLRPISFPVFPYHYFAAKPAYQADQTGTVRKAMAIRPVTPPPDGPVLAEVSKSQMQEIRQRYGF